MKRNWTYHAPLGARVRFLNADADRQVTDQTTGVVVWVAPDGQCGRDVRLADGREVNIPNYELVGAPLTLRLYGFKGTLTARTPDDAHQTALELTLAGYDVELDGQRVDLYDGPSQYLVWHDNPDSPVLAEFAWIAE